jgi:hypothetical protein
MAETAGEGFRVGFRGLNRQSWGLNRLTALHWVEVGHCSNGQGNGTQNGTTSHQAVDEVPASSQTCGQTLVNTWSNTCSAVEDEESSRYGQEWEAVQRRCQRGAEPTTQQLFLIVHKQLFANIRTYHTPPPHMHPAAMESLACCAQLLLSSKDDMHNCCCPARQEAASAAA